MNAGRILRLRDVSRQRERREQSGFTLIELSIVMVIAALLLVPLLRMAGSAVISTRLESTQGALERASEALISFAAANSGCLPFASDFEGGLPDTDAGGTGSGNPDQGNRGVGSDKNAGDLPWADLGLTNDFLDGDGLRIQYYVATPYTDTDGNQPIITCDAGFKGFQWDSSVTYDSPSDASLWFYDYDPLSGVRALYELRKGDTKILPAGIHPSDGGDVTEHVNPLPDTLLQLRRGPDVMSATNNQNDVISLRNVFILIAPGKNRNAELDRLFSRDSTHVTDLGAVWALGVNEVDDHIFSSEANVDASDAADNGDDTMLIMSFTRFKAEMGKHGLNMEQVCETPC